MLWSRPGWHRYFDGVPKAKPGKMTLNVSLRFGLEIVGLGIVPFGMTTDKMLAVVGTPDSAFNGRHEFRNLGCFIDVRPAALDQPTIVDAVEFWNNGAANVASVLLFGTDVLREPAASTKALLESLNGGPGVDGWYVNLDVFISGGNPTYAQQAIDQARREGTFDQNKEVLLEELEKATLLTSFGFGRPGYCSDGLAELAKLEQSSSG
jgi:hypothetical protein